MWIRRTRLRGVRRWSKLIDALRGFRSPEGDPEDEFHRAGRKVKETAGGMFYDPPALWLSSGLIS